jgi:hypothetical protein
MANLMGADLYSTRLADAILLDVNLSDVRNLEACLHVAPCFIDHRTLQRSGPLPLSFLRDCGLQDNLIGYLPSLLNQPIQFYSCFLSHSSKDDEFARRLYADLQDKGVRCWFAAEDLKVGDRIRDTIDRMIRVRDKLLVVLSENSIASQWVEDEVEAAIEEERKEFRATHNSVPFANRRRGRPHRSRLGARDHAHPPHRRLQPLEGARRLPEGPRAAATRPQARA